jgi:hypothetical protein
MHTNVGLAGAVMKSGDQTIAGAKTFTSSISATSGIVASTVTTTSDPKLKKNTKLLDNCCYC